MQTIFWTDLNAPDAAEMLTQDPQTTFEPKIASDWAPYESKMVC